MVVDLRQAAADVAARRASMPSAIVKDEVDRILLILRPEAARNVTGGVAAMKRRIEARLQKAIAAIKHLETKLDQPGTNAKIAAEIDRLFFDIAGDWVSYQLALPTGGGLEERLPKWFRNWIELAKKRGGVPVAGGGIRPFNLENTTGTRREPNYKGEVIPYHALPEKQREGLRPDGLVWIYNL